MTDTQAKIADVEASWRIALRGPKFPTHHGADDFEDTFAQIHSALFTIYGDNVSRVMAEVLRREATKAHRRKVCLKVAIISIAVATLLLVYATRFN